MLFWAVAVATAATCSAEDLFGTYFTKSSGIASNSLKAHAEFAFKTAGVSTLDTTGEMKPSGFLYVNFYNATSCGGQIVASSGRPTNKCIVSYDDPSSATPTGSYMYTCDSANGYSTQYTDTECKNKQITLIESLTCKNALAKYASGVGHCTSDPSVLPVPAGAFSTQIEYGSPTSCTAAPINQYKSYLDGVCFHPSAGVSEQFAYPDVTTFAATTCTGTGTTTTTSETCLPVTVYPTNGENLATKWATGTIRTGYTYDPGYFYFNFYQSKDCDNQIVAVEGQPTDVCLLTYDDAGAVVGSKIFTCDSSNGYEAIFSDGACTVPAVPANATKALECVNLNGRFGSQKGMCNSVTSRLPLDGTTFVTQVLYDTPNTCAKKASFNSFLNDECFGNSGGKGLSYQFPQVNYWNDPTCVSLNSTTAIPNTCVPVAAYPAHTSVASQWYYGDVNDGGTFPPTATPTAAPTPDQYEKGFVYVNFYEGKACSGAVVAVTGSPTETCLQIYDDLSSSVATGSYKLHCQGSESIKTVYSDLNCQTPNTNVNPMASDFSCRNLLGTLGSANGMCNSDSSRLPLPASNFTSNIQYNSPSTCDATIQQFESWMDGHCFDNAGTQAYSYDYPVFTQFEGYSCAGKVARNETLNPNCQVVDAYPATSGSNLATKWVYGNVNFGGGGSSDDLSTAAIAGIAAGGAVAVVAVAAGAYFFLGGAGGATASATTGAGAAGVNPMVSAV